MDKPRPNAAPARTGSYPSAHAGLLLHVRHQVENGEPQFGVHLAPHVGDVSGPAYCTVRGVAALDVFVSSPAAVSADLAALVVAGGHYVLTLEAAAQLAADFALPVRAPPLIEGA
ncbi:hypothetical protein PK69_18030 [Xanthomonas phaseoli pv. phaseoli]|uniref:Uncharacterized protein n=1 Tax=Xanthomonas campestris pv. phaseoli TaxID=317013 RepID=A0AB34QDN6_XANCH|nr:MULTISPECIES: hypothetical protein [Xanthomonas]ATS24115.1 hypothetical protein XppCFBP412P_22730 [Xanthomonas phaseoli pv. phaseoli]ATS28377.1 hypothetical protein XppCFBP6164P_23530 [Xanthomonas phaseoli pv. phaseoli]ATS36597.1 hypothetical protein XppCFBP6982P_22865 [Xanthomonas phaseoli pv. phaseoli]AZU15480.1 hypothetical protein AC609_23040 [Xanthomonas phaseoli pv. phaseoli]AZU28238.1 hypothetical protein AC611_23065 [Xanthomonas phaseoli pv. phaseoli]